jgi:hypothetical protein
MGASLGLAIFVGTTINTSSAYAVTATDVDCVQCIGKTEIKAGNVTQGRLGDGAVATRKIQKLAVTTAKIADGAVTYDKLNPSVQDAIDGFLSYDYRDFEFGGSGGSAITQRVYSISGTNLWQCGGVDVDTEVRDIARTVQSDGSTHIVTTVRNYSGGIAGTPCNIGQIEFIADSDGLKIIRTVNYEADGVTVSKETNTTYDIVDDPAAGLKLLSGDMQIGVDFVSAGKTTNSTTSDVGMYVNESKLIGVGVTATVDPGGPNEEALTGCIKMHESRVSSHFGVAERVKTYCPGVGMVELLKGEPTTDKTRYYQLVDYTLSP